MTQSVGRPGQIGSARSVVDPVQLVDADVDDDVYADVNTDVYADVDADVDHDIMMMSSLTWSLTRPGY